MKRQAYWKVTVFTDPLKAFSQTSHLFAVDHFIMVFLTNKLTYTKKAKHAASESHGVLPEILNRSKNLKCPVSLISTTLLAFEEV